MANIKSNDKSKRQDDKRNIRNKSLKSEIKTIMKKVDTSKTEELVNEAIKLIDKAVTSGVFHKNKAARLKSKMHLVETTKEKTEIKKVVKKESKPITEK